MSAGRRHRLPRAAQPPHPHRAARDGVVLLTASGIAVGWGRRLASGSVPGGAHRWQRTNHAGRGVTLTEGLALVGAVAGSAGAAAVLRLAGTRAAAAVVVAALGAGLVGAVDDLHPDAARKGLRGHLGALRHGHLTTGALKVVGLAATGVLAAGLGGRRPGRLGGLPEALLGGAVVAGCANLTNLLDLRPGRALKAGLLVGIPMLLSGGGSLAAASATGAALALLPEDLAGRSMLGDTGANPLGAVLGVALVQRQGTSGRLLTLGVLTALTLASERVSFTAVIEATPVLRELDALGRPRPSP